MDVAHSRAVASQQLLSLSRLISETVQSQRSPRVWSECRSPSLAKSVFENQMKSLLANDCISCMIGFLVDVSEDFLDNINILRILSRTLSITCRSPTNHLSGGTHSSGWIMYSAWNIKNDPTAVTGPKHIAQTAIKCTEPHKSERAQSEIFKPGDTHPETRVRNRTQSDTYQTRTHAIATTSTHTSIKTIANIPDRTNSHITTSTDPQVPILSVAQAHGQTLSGSHAAPIHTGTHCQISSGSHAAPIHRGTQDQISSGSHAAPIHRGTQDQISSGSHAAQIHTDTHDQIPSGPHAAQIHPGTHGQISSGSHAAQIHTDTHDQIHNVPHAAPFHTGERAQILTGTRAHSETQSEFGNDISAVCADAVSALEAYDGLSKIHEANSMTEVIRESESPRTVVFAHPLLADKLDESGEFSDGREDDDDISAAMKSEFEKLISDVLDQPTGVDPITPPDEPEHSPLRALLEDRELFDNLAPEETSFISAQIDGNVKSPDHQSHTDVSMMNRYVEQNAPFDSSSLLSPLTHTRSDSDLKVMYSDNQSVSKGYATSEIITPTDESSPAFNRKSDDFGSAVKRLNFSPTESQRSTSSNVEGVQPDPRSTPNVPLGEMPNDGPQESKNDVPLDIPVDFSKLSKKESDTLRCQFAKLLEIQKERTLSSKPDPMSYRIPQDIQALRVADLKHDNAELEVRIADLTLENLSAKSVIRSMQSESRFSEIFDEYEKTIAKLQQRNAKLERLSVSKLLNDGKDCSGPHIKLLRRSLRDNEHRSQVLTQRNFQLTKNERKVEIATKFLTSERKQVTLLSKQLIEAKEQLQTASLDNASLASRSKILAEECRNLRATNGTLDSQLDKVKQTLKITRSLVMKAEKEKREREIYERLGLPTVSAKPEKYNSKIRKTFDRLEREFARGFGGSPSRITRTLLKDLRGEVETLETSRYEVMKREQELFNMFVHSPQRQQKIRRKLSVSQPAINHAPHSHAVRSPQWEYPHKRSASESLSRINVESPRGRRISRPSSVL
eukprot:354348_1